MANAKSTCFVVMGFGKKTDFETGHTFDLDKSYRNLIKPAVVAAGYDCVRADEIVHSGLIDVPMYEQLLVVDIVVADLSTSALAPPASAATHSAMMKQVNDSIDKNDLVSAKSLLGAMRTLMTNEAPGRAEDPHIVQRLAFVTYKSKHPSELTALKEAATLLASLEPQTSNDTETLGLWGAVHKRLWALTQDTIHLDEAIRALERGFYVRNDYYNGINLAFLLNLRASRATDPAEAITDFMLARRVRQEVLTICEKWLIGNPGVAASTAEPARRQHAETRYWVLATLGEALVGLGDLAAPQRLEAIYAAAPAPWMADTTREQVGKLRALLVDAPLKHLKGEDR